jgi:hypothetical protein
MVTGKAAKPRSGQGSSFNGAERAMFSVFFVFHHTASRWNVLRIWARAAGTHVDAGSVPGVPDRRPEKLIKYPRKSKPWPAAPIAEHRNTKTASVFRAGQEGRKRQQLKPTGRPEHREHGKHRNELNTGVLYTSGIGRGCPSAGLNSLSKPSVFKTVGQEKILCVKPMAVAGAGRVQNENPTPSAE